MRLLSCSVPFVAPSPGPLRGLRDDYIFSSNELRSDGCEYIAAWIERDADGRRLSDHAAVEADLSVAV